MDTKEKIVPHKITKPIQLLAAWLTGLILVNASFLTAATQLNDPSWLPPTLVIASIINVFVFLFSIYQLQTRYRPEMQEDSFYSQYLEKKTMTGLSIETPNKLGRMDDLEIAKESIKLSAADKKEKVLKIEINDYLPLFTELRVKLKNLGYNVDNVFGKINSTERPDRFVLAINKYTDFELVKPIIKIMPEFGIFEMKFFEPLVNFDDSDLYIGAYNYSETLNITTEFIKNLDEYDEQDIKRLIRFATTNK